MIGAENVKNNTIKLIIVTILVILILFAIAVFGNYFEHDGLLLENIEKVNGVKYAFSRGNNYGLYYSDNIGGEYTKISEFAPLSKESVFFDDDFIYFASRERKVIAISLSDYKNFIFDIDDRIVNLFGLNKEYLIAKDYNETNDLIIIDIKTQKIVDVIMKNGSKIDVTAEFLTFWVSDELTWYRYYFENGTLEKGNQ